MTHLDDLLSAWLDGELDPAEREWASGHLAQCGECRSDLAVVEAARGRLRGLPSLHLPTGLLPIDEPRRRSWAWATAAALALLIAVGLWIGPGQPGAAFEMDVLDEQHVARVVGDPGVSTFRGEQP